MPLLYQEWVWGLVISIYFREALSPRRLCGCCQIRKVRNSGTNYDRQEVLTAEMSPFDWHMCSSVHGVLPHIGAALFTALPHEIWDI